MSNFKVTFQGTSPTGLHLYNIQQSFVKMSQKERRKTGLQISQQCREQGGVGIITETDLPDKIITATKKQSPTVHLLSDIFKEKLLFFSGLLGLDITKINQSMGFRDYIDFQSHIKGTEDYLVDPHTDIDDENHATLLAPGYIWNSKISAGTFLGGLTINNHNKMANFPGFEKEICQESGHAIKPFEDIPSAKTKMPFYLVFTTQERSLGIDGLPFLPVVHSVKFTQQQIQYLKKQALLNEYLTRGVFLTDLT